MSLQGTALQRVTDVALGVVIPVHSHIAINSVLSDYVPKSVMGEGRPEMVPAAPTLPIAGAWVQQAA